MVEDLYSITNISQYRISSITVAHLSVFAILKPKTAQKLVKTGFDDIEDDLQDTEPAIWPLPVVSYAVLQYFPGGVHIWYTGINFGPQLCNYPIDMIANRPNEFVGTIFVLYLDSFTEFRFGYKSLF